jgi:hypothetical protein
LWASAAGVCECVCECVCVCGVGDEPDTKKQRCV